MRSASRPACLRAEAHGAVVGAAGRGLALVQRCVGGLQMGNETGERVCTCSALGLKGVESAQCLLSGRPSTPAECRNPFTPRQPSPSSAHLQRSRDHAKLHCCVALDAQAPAYHGLIGGGAVGQQELGPHAVQPHRLQAGGCSICGAGRQCATGR